MVAKPRSRGKAVRARRTAHGDGQDLDLREQLFNQRLQGPITEMALPEAAITTLHAVMLDVDPSLLRPEVRGRSLDPTQVYRRLVAPMLDRHPTLARAEVRSSGRGLHVLLWMDPPVAFATAAERDRWAGVTRAIQALLPSDPDAPGITSLTRPLGSRNGKNGAVVAQLRAGRPVPPAEVLALFDDLRRRPFRTVMNVLLGGERVTPCPVCRRPDSALAALDRKGVCYGHCGDLSLAKLLDLFLVPRQGG
jgi:hypothetical protein